MPEHTHKWRIEPPDGPTSSAYCCARNGLPRGGVCRERREFVNGFQVNNFHERPIVEDRAPKEPRAERYVLSDDV